MMRSSQPYATIQAPETFPIYKYSTTPLVLYCCHLHIDIVYFVQMNDENDKEMPFDYFTHFCCQNFRPFLAYMGAKPMQTGACFG